MMWSRALLLASLIATCYSDGEPELEESNFSLQSARSIFGSITDLFNVESYVPGFNNATEEISQLFTRNHTQEILHKLQKSIVDTKLSDLVPSFILNSANTRPTGRSVGGLFSTFRNTLNDFLDNTLGWLILQGYTFMPDRMDAVMGYLEAVDNVLSWFILRGHYFTPEGMNAIMEYLESESQYWDGKSGHNVHRRDAGIDDNDFIRMMDSYHPDEHPPSSDPAECPNDSSWYSEYVTVVGLDYWADVKKRADAALKKIRENMDDE